MLPFPKVPTEKELVSFNLDFDKFHQAAAELKTDKIFRMSKAVTNIAAEVKEEEKLVILIDIVGFSKDTTRNQVYKIYLFQRYLMSKVLGNKFSLGGKVRINHFVPTGDGCYIVAEKCESETALNLLITIISGFKDIQTEGSLTMSLRVSALFGTVVPFIDMAHHLNYIGDGMNEASRILSGGQKILEERYLLEHKDAHFGDEKKYSRNSLFLGDSLTQNIEDYKESCAQIFRFPEVSDKHGIKRNVTVLQGIL